MRGEPGGTWAVKAALLASAASVLLTLTIGLLGPSAVVPALTGEPWQPPYSLQATPSPHLVIGLAAAVLVLGGMGLVGGLLAIRTSPTRVAEWATGKARWVVAAGYAAATALAFVPPSGSADHLNYAAYGRMVTLGLDPYVLGAVDLPGDPVAAAVESPWREEPSVYGPVATAVQALASWIGGDSVRLTVFVLAVVNVAAFVGTGLLIDRFTRHDPVRRLRGAMLWTANPLLIYQLVAGMHVDTLAIACMVAALLARDRPGRSGVLLGLGVAVKLNAGLVALGPAWELRRRPGRLALVAGVALAVVVAGYAIVGVAAFNQVGQTSKAISHASFWKLVQGWLQSLIGTGSAYRGEIQVGAILLMVVLAWGLLRRVSRAADAPGVGAPAVDAPTVAAMLAVAYLFATPYILPWYDGLAFGVLALVVASEVEVFAALHLAILSLGYLPARVQEQPPDLAWLVSVVRQQVVPWSLLVLTAALAWWAWRAGGRVRQRPAPEAPRR
ncbi:polyprenol phosphomannose-dependent alpha 1,6 mannosyltransferase MptB [Nonomuraea sp. NPDC050310]|uniref:polyprenol phosphomannose-dependent alpha 1,6 mannosyltransferase MptB n=1 Tax=Nonomuraea sp. NPDC050310 TaxID=3154935 RepID=UPI0033DA8FE0